MEKTEHEQIRRSKFEAFGESMDIWTIPINDTDSSRENIIKIILEFTKHPDIKIETNPHGKPYSKQLTKEGVFFNYSHSHKMILLIISENPYTGVDLEYIYQPLDIDSLANTCLTDTEAETIKTFNNRINVILTYWTRKEAILKAKGIGHLVDMKTINIPIHSKPELTTYSNQEWLLKTLTPAYGYIASIAVKNKNLSKK